MKPYEHYKETGLNWLPKIPTHWGMVRNGVLFSEVVDTGYNDLELLSITTDKGIIKQTDTGRKKRASDDMAKYKRIRPGDIGYNLMNAFMGAIGMSDYEGIISPAYAVCRPKVNLNSQYYHYLFRTPLYKQEFDKNSYGIMYERNRLYFDHFASISVPAPDIKEQNTIVAYIQKAEEKIDKYIETKQKEISVLEEYKQTIINEAVTKGLDRATQMKDSGIEWIGKIPAHWEVSTVRRFYISILGKMLQNSSKSSTDTVEKYLCAKDIHFGNVDKSNLKSMWFSEADKKIYHVLDGDLLIVEGGAGAGGCSIYHGNDNIFVQNSVHVVRPKSDMTNTFLCYWLEYLVKRGYIDYACNKATIPHFTKDKLLDTPIVILPINEQYKIITYINERIQKIIAVIATIQKQIASLNEYRTTLISDVVTGQVNVCESQ